MPAYCLLMMIPFGIMGFGGVTFSLVIHWWLNCEYELWSCHCRNETRAKTSDNGLSVRVGAVYSDQSILLLYIS